MNCIKIDCTVWSSGWIHQEAGTCKFRGHIYILTRSGRGELPIAARGVGGLREGGYGGGVWKGLREGGDGKRGVERKTTWSNVTDWVFGAKLAILMRLAVLRLLPVDPMVGMTFFLSQCESLYSLWSRTKSKIRFKNTKIFVNWLMRIKQIGHRCNQLILRRTHEVLNFQFVTEGMKKQWKQHTMKVKV